MAVSLNRAHPQNLKKTIFRLFSYLKCYLPILIIVFFLVIYSSLANIVGTYISGTVIINQLSDSLANNLPFDVAIKEIATSCLVLLVIYILGVASNILYTQIMVRICQDVLYRLRKDLLLRMHKLKISYFDKHTNGEIMSYYTNDVDSIMTMINDSLGNIILSLCNIIGTITCLFLINVYLSLIVIFFIALMFLCMYFSSKRAHKYFKKQQDTLAKINSAAEEDLVGMKTIKAYQHEKISFTNFQNLNDNWRKDAAKAFFFTQINTPFFVSLSYLNFSISAIVGCVFLSLNMIASGIGGLTSYLVFVRTAAQPFNLFTQHINNILSASAGAERIFNFLDEEIEEDNGKYSLIKISDDKNSESRYAFTDGEKIFPLRGKIAFEHVYFSYVPNKPILKDISFIAPEHTKVAFVGSTGAGKTTIISLLARFYKVDQGRITYDGIDIQDIKLNSLRRSLSLVTQDTHLFTASIKDNISYVRRHSSEEEIIEASKKARADYFIRRMTDKYETIIYDDGNNLSQGERQLLGLARATLLKTPLIILDEATSNIDTLSEKLIHNALKDLLSERTSIVIAHRLSTIKDADMIYVLSDGKIIESGNEKMLLEKKGAYYDLYTGNKELA